jgi:hypothetical protein
MHNNFPSLVAVVVLAIAIYFATPASLIWGWVCWTRSTSPRSVLVIFSVAGMALASVSALVALVSVFHAQAIGGFPYYDSRLLRYYRWGGVLSMGAILFALVGIWRKNPIRWFALAGAVGTLAFWFVSAVTE